MKMDKMTSYSKGYSAPSGSAGGEAYGKFSTKGNPRSVPKKGSSLSGGSEYGNNSDRQKVQGLSRSQMAKESLRGEGC